MLLLGGAAAAAVADDQGSDPDGGVVTLLPVEPAPTVSAYEATRAEARRETAARWIDCWGVKVASAIEPAFIGVSGHPHAVAFRLRGDPRRGPHNMAALRHSDGV